MKIIFHILWAIIVSIAIAGFIFYVGLWFSWVRVIEPETGYYIGIFLGLLFLIGRVTKILKRRINTDNE